MVITIKTKPEKTNSVANATSTKLPVTWKHLLLLYTNVNVNIPGKDGSTVNHSSVMPQSLRETLIGAYENLPNLVTDCSGGNVKAEVTLKVIDEPLTTVSELREVEGQMYYWVAPGDVEADIEKYAPKGTFDSVHVIWNNDGKKGVPTYFGLGGTLLHDKTTTYDSIQSGAEFWWTGIGEAYGEAILHEWLHGVTSFMWSRDYGRENFPKGDLHGADNYDYVHSPPEGWMQWYRDYMQCKIWSEKEQKYLGISKEAWAMGSPISFVQK